MTDSIAREINSNEPILYSSNPKTTPLRYPKRLMNNPVGTAITRQPIYIIAWIKAECAFVISSVPENAYSAHPEWHVQIPIGKREK